MKHPFSEILRDGFNYRTFNSNLNENDLKWHWDEEDRIVVCEHETDWMFQMDNCIPVNFTNKEFLIPKGHWHRIIKGSGDLTLRIKKIYE